MLGGFVALVLACITLVVWATSSDARTERAAGWLHWLSR
jgi:hypothetical protein